MYKYTVLFVAAILCSVQCLPFEMSSHKESSSSSQLHLVVENSTQATNYHLTPFLDELEDIDKEIEDQLQAIMPYLNFFFDTLLGKSSGDDDDCTNDMVIELVPEKSATADNNDEPQPTPKTDDKTEPSPATTSDKDNTKPDSGTATDNKDNSEPTKPSTPPQNAVNDTKPNTETPSPAETPK